LRTIETRCGVVVPGALFFWNPFSSYGRSSFPCSNVRNSKRDRFRWSVAAASNDFCVASPLVVVVVVVVVAVAVYLPFPLV